MDKEEIKEYFDRVAATWDQEERINPPVIRKILQGARCTAGKKVLDVACGTGVMIPFYLEREVSSVTAVDISSQMVRIAREKFSDPRVKILQADVERREIGEKFDCIMIYNAFPHFPDPENLIRVLSEMLAPGGTLTVAHGMSREWINRHHQGRAAHVSIRLMDEKMLSRLFAEYVTVTTVISDDSMFQVTGIQR